MSFEDSVRVLIAVMLIAVLVLIWWGVRAVSPSYLRSRGEAFALRNRLYVDAAETATIDAFVGRDRRWRHLMTAALLVSFVALAGVLLETDLDPEVVVLIALLCAIPVATLSGRRPEVLVPPETRRVSVSDFVHPAIRGINAAMVVVSAAVLVWGLVAPSDHDSWRPVMFAALPLVGGLIAELAAEMSAFRAVGVPRWLAYLHDARQGEVVARGFALAPLMTMSALWMALAELDAFGLALVVIFGSGAGAMVQATVLKRDSLRFRRQLWPDLGPDEIVSSATA